MIVTRISLGSMTFKPFISIVIPAYNRPDRLEECLESIAQLNYSRDCFEVTVVDDGSPIPLTGIGEKFKSQIPLNFIRQDNVGPANARNTGAAASQGQYIAFTDDDCRVHPDWLAALAAVYEQQPDALVGGRTLNALPENVYSTASQLLIDYLYSYYNPDQGAITFFASNNFAVSRNRFQKLGGFDTGFPLAAGEDREFCDRWIQQGWPMVYGPKMMVYHAHYLSLAKFWQQHFNYGRGAYCFHRARANRGMGKVKVEPFKFYRQLLTYPLSRWVTLHQIQLTGLLLLSQFANTAGFFWERHQQITDGPSTKTVSC